MRMIRAEYRLCACCMEEHDVKYVVVKEHNVFKGINVDFDAEYFYCDRASEFFSDEKMLKKMI